MKDCVSLDIAKKLQEAGWKQDDGTYYHYYLRLDGQYSTESVHHLVLNRYTIAAPTTGELLEALPTSITIFGEGSDEWGLNLYPRIDKRWGCSYQREGFEIETRYSQDASTPADALALLWLALKEKNLL